MRAPVRVGSRQCTQAVNTLRMPSTPYTVMVQRMSADQPMVGGGHTISVPHGSISGNHSIPVILGLGVGGTPNTASALRSRPPPLALATGGYPSFRAGSPGQSRRADAPGTPGASMRSVRSAVVTG